MPEYVLPEIKNASEEVGMVRDSYAYPDEYARKITIPVNPEILAGLMVGEAASITLTGNIQELSSNQSADSAGRTSVTINLDKVEAYPVDYDMEDDDLSDEMAAEEDMAKGFGSGRGRFGGGMGMI